MNSVTEYGKLAELRAKTDRELYVLINKSVGDGLTLARLAGAAEGSRIPTEELHHKAERAYAEAALLLPVLGSVTEMERTKLRLRLAQLREMLDRLSSRGSTPNSGERGVTALAHILWKVRGCPAGSPEEDWYRAERALKPHASQLCCSGAGSAR